MSDNLLPLFIGCTFLILLFSFSFTVITMVSKVKQKTYVMEKSEMTYQFEKELLQTKLELQEIGLNQLSQEIHDNVGQSLAVVMNTLIELSRTVSEENRQIFELSKSELSKAMKGLRNASHVLNGDYINAIGLEESLKQGLAYLTINNNIRFDFLVEGDPDLIAGEKVLMIFRIAQEILMNIFKHSQATYLKINLNYQPDNFNMVIADNGIGFDEEKVKNNGIGLISIKQRVSILKGSITIHPKINNGTTVNLNVPI